MGVYICEDKKLGGRRERGKGETGERERERERGSKCVK